MIQVTGLTKIYKSTRRLSYKALKGVSFTLPDHGMVFVVGKSGCGKSTLLNLLGGLDSPSGGDIFVDGKPFSKFSERDFDAYRNSYLGFVFQSFNLIDSLTVKENVKLALRLKGEDGDPLADEILGAVGLAEHSHKYPKQLSGGQCQRVSIARALVKSPQVVLADEPTGNLDSRSGRRILNILKDYSKTHLVLIVSHNREDADIFADRIIELADGRIVGDYDRNPLSGDLVIDDEGITLQRGVALSEEQINKINERLSSGKPAVFKQADDRFVPAKPPEPAAPAAKMARSKPSFKGFLKLFLTFLRKQKLSLIVTLILVIGLVSVLGTGQLFLLFDADEECASLLQKSDYSVFYMHKSYINGQGKMSTDRCYPVAEKDIEAFEDTGYGGTIYKLYNVGLGTVQTEYSLENYQRLGDDKIYADYFCKAGNGVMVCDEQFLINTYGDGTNMPEVLSGAISADSAGIIVTDYFADSILGRSATLAATGDDIYAKLTDGRTMFSRYKIDAVINTRYKERYADIVLRVENGESFRNMENDAMYTDFMDELNLTLNTAYSINPDFVNAFTSTTNKGYSYLCRPSVQFEGKTYSNKIFYCTRNSSVKDGEIYVSKTVWRSLTGDSLEDDSPYWQALKGKKLKIVIPASVTGGAAATLEFTVAGTTDEHGMLVSNNTLAKLRKYELIPFGLYFDDTQNLGSLFTAGKAINFYPTSLQFRAVQSIAGAVKIFKDFFTLIISVLYFVSALLLLSFGTRSVKKNVYEIGVLRAMGARVGHLAVVFVAQILLLGLLICLLGILGTAVGVSVGNAVLVKGFIAYTGNNLASHITFIRFRTGTVLAGAALVIGVSLLACARPIIALTHVKPRDVINSKE